MTPEDERKVLDAALVVSRVFPQFDRRIEQLEEHSGRVPDQIETLHKRISDTNGQLKTTSEELKDQMEDLSKQMLTLNESMLGLTSAVQGWEGAQRILAEATAASAATSSTQNGHVKPVEENGNGNGNGNGTKDEKEKARLRDAIGRVVLWAMEPFFKTKARAVASAAVLILGGGGGTTAYFIKSCAPVQALVAPSPTHYPAGPQRAR